MCISGWANDTEALNPLASALSDYPVASLSLADLLRQAGEEPGDGASEISSYARAIAGHLERSTEPACLIGWSTGGIAAIEAAGKFPGKVAGLVLLSSTARFCSGSNYSAGVDSPVLRAMIRKLKRNPEALIGDFFSQAVFPWAIAENDLACRKQNALDQGVDVLIDGLEYLARIDLTGSLRTITAPCLVIHGRQDRIVPWQASEFLNSNLPLSDFLNLPSAGHMIIEQCPSEVIPRIIQFLGFLP